MSTPGAITDGVGLVVALPAEAHSLGVHGVHPGECKRWRHGWVAVSGIGPHNAIRAAERLLACGIGHLANWGVAGALDADLAPGDVLLPEQILYAPDAPGFATDADTRACLGMALSPRLRVRGGILWSAAQPVANAADKHALAARSGAVAVDMEAASIAAVAARANVPFVALKAICDPATRELPAGVVRALGASDGGFSWRMLSAILLGGPASWQAARALARDFARARHALATAATLAA